MSSVEAEYESYLVENWTTDILIIYLKEQDLNLDDDDLAILRKKKFNGLSFLEMTKEDFMQAGLAMGPAILLAKEVLTLKEKPKRSFSSYNTQNHLKDVLSEYEVDRIIDLPQFVPKTHNIEDKDKALLHCLKDIRLRLRNMGTVADSNEAVRCEYISAILHACIHIVRKLTGKEISLNPQLEVVGEENGGRVDYAIKCIEELIAITEGKQHQISIGFAQNVLQCKSAYQTNKRKRKAGDAFGEEYDYLFGIVTTATEWYFLLYTSDGISCTSKNPLNIRFVESALKKDSEEEKELHKNVKRVMEVIVGLLKDRVDVEKEPAMKKQRVQGFFEKE